MQDYVIVKFLAENMIEYIPSIWLDGSCTKAYWPSNAVVKHRKEKTPPDNAWQKFDVKVYKYAEDECDARRLCQKYQGTSEIEESDGGATKKRKKKLRVMSDSSDDISQINDSLDGKKKRRVVSKENVQGGQSNSDDDYDDGLLHKLPKFPQPEMTVSTSHPVPQSQYVDDAGVNHRITSRPVLQARQLEDAGVKPRSSSRPVVSRYLDDAMVNRRSISRPVLQSLHSDNVVINAPSTSRYMLDDSPSLATATTSHACRCKHIDINFERKMFTLLHSMNDRLQHLEAQERQRIDLNIMPTLPISSQEEWTMWNEWLETDVQMDTFKQYVKNVGGATTGEKVRRVLKRMFNKQMAEKMSWKGSNGAKVMFSTSRVQTCLFDALRAASKCFDESQAETAAKNWLKLAKQRQT